MPITIQEIIASDTISQLVDKTNFNFDQLLLNGGGPAGPKGPAGPIGPAGGRGPKGSTWYEDTTPFTTPPVGVSPNVSPPTPNPLEGDYYLQANGQVWEYNGTTWVPTQVDLQGPTGAAGLSGGFGSYFGQGSLNNFNTTLATPKGIGGTGATAVNQGILTVLVGGAASNTSTADSGQTLTSEYQLTDTLALSMASDVVSLMVHQKNTASRAIVLHGGADATNSELMEQNNLGNLSAIKLGIDDRMIIDIPKPATNPSSNTDVIGFQVDTGVGGRGVDIFSGGQVTISSGNNSAPYSFAGENQNIEINIGTGATGIPATGNKFRLVGNGTQGSGIFELGNNVTLPSLTLPNASTTVTANSVLQASNIMLTTDVNGKILGVAGGGISLSNGNNGIGNIDLNAAVGGLQLNSTGNVSLVHKGAANPGLVTILNEYTGANNATGQVFILTHKDISLRNAVLNAQQAPSIVLNYTNATASHTRFRGINTWAKTDPAGTGQGPILSDDGGSIYQFNNVDGVLTQGLFESFRRVGSKNTTDFLPGGSLEQWMLGTGTFSQVKGNQISISVGDESLINPVPTTYSPSTTVSGNDGAYDPSMDSSLGIEVRTTEATIPTAKQFFNANAQKISIAAPLVFKRSQNRNANGNNKPIYHSPQYLDAVTTGPPYGGGGNYPSFGYDFMSNQSLSSSIATTSGMPTTADLAKAPLIFLRFGFGVGQRATSAARAAIAGQIFVNNYDNSFKFPLGAYPGQKIIVVIENYSTLGQYNSQLGGTYTFSNYGTVRINFPLNRKYMMAGANWTDWYENGSAATNALYSEDGTRGYRQITLGTNSIDANGSRMRRKVVELVWNGNIARSWAKYQAMGNPNGDRIYNQSGWMIANGSSLDRNEFNINAF